ncbi:hypothetical protein JY01_06265 [Neisseria meningitidis]|nr:hypothetical protein BFO62_04965 [Neisseria meningitidis]OQC77464.1 hypothetical protein BFO77_07250 [Neisseria meningitidis]PKT98824.1 hypothetical protein CWI46_06480 [Neisseria meningitidis]PKT99762.1 hypothetical protein CWI60_09160 [Neisseria meningitidis]PKU03692.1 hypothetical protein CWI43_00165 [Neisseria meningitidis]
MVKNAWQSVENGVHFATWNYTTGRKCRLKGFSGQSCDWSGVSSETVKQKFAGVELSYAGKAAGESLYCL